MTVYLHCMLASFLIGCRLRWRQKMPSSSRRIPNFSRRMVKFSDKLQNFERGLSGNRESYRH